jgi:Ca-activated chloride channel family protein
MAFVAWFAVGVARAGTVTGVVVDDAEVPLPGVDVVLTAADGTRIEAETDAGGQVRMELSAGTATITASGEGFGQRTMWVVVPEVGDVSWILHLTPEVESTGRGEVLTREFLQKIPTGRSYQAATQMAAGVLAGSGGNPNMAGGATRESYVHPGNHPTVMADQDRWSTFAIDVDTASYALTRAKLRSSVLPDAASVRVEEFVNAMPYAYAPPVGGDPFAVHLEAAPHPLRPDHLVVSIALQGRPPPLRARPMHLTFLVDVSGSMASADKLPLAQQALHHLVDGLGPEDEVSLVTYAGRTAVSLEPTGAARAADIHAAIDGLWAGGGTAMHDGIGLAYGMAEDMYTEGSENRVVILTDGDPNIGVASPEGLVDLVHRWAGKGIGLSVVGFGQGNLGDALLERLADQGDGNYHYLDSRAEAERVFGRDLVGNLSTVARDVKVQVEFPEDAVFAWRQVGYENRAVADEDFRNDAVDGGELGWGQQVTALYEVVLRDHPRGPLVRVSARAEPSGREAAATESSFALGVSEAQASWEAASDSLQWATATATFAEVLRGSPHEAETSWGQVLALVDDAAQTDRQDHAELRSLVERAARLSGGLDTLPTPNGVRPPPPRSFTRR